jgi:single-stranded DNA-specific DHH superfamily exonuclease
MFNFIMDVEYMLGSKKEFHDFVNLITHNDRVAVLSHIDLDGLASAIFLEEILEKKNIAINYLDFLDIHSDMLKEVLVKLDESNISKVFICDIGSDSIDPEGLHDLQMAFDVFMIDHHPINEEYPDKRNMIKTSSNDCSALTIFDLGKDLLDVKEWNWLVCSAIFSDFSHKKLSHLNYIQEVYPGISIENISSSTPGINARKINSALIYYNHNRLYVYDLVKNRRMNEISEIHELMEEEVDKIVEGFTFAAEHYPDKNLHVYQFESKFNLVSTVSSLISKMRPMDSFVLIQRLSGGVVKASARNQEMNRDMGLLMKKCTHDLVGASGGGHRAAASAKFMIEDFEEFKRRLVE